jgi:hypothetical protein
MVLDVYPMVANFFNYVGCIVYMIPNCFLPGEFSPLVLESHSETKILMPLTCVIPHVPAPVNIHDCGFFVYPSV